MACGGGPEGREDVAAEAGTESLPTERLANWIARVPTGRPTLQDGATVSLVWIDYTLLQQALTEGGSLSDSAALARALHPDRMLLALRVWHDTLSARRPPVDPDRADSLYAGDHRVFQHILLRVNPQDARSVSDARARMDTVLAQARAGTDFALLAQRHSEDPSAVGGGFLPVRRRGQLDRELERRIWPLDPGQIEGFPLQAGILIVRRPPLAEVRERFLAYADTIATREADRRHAEDLRVTAAFRLEPGAVEALRAFFNDPAARAGDAVLAAWIGGNLTLRQAALWIDILPPASYVNLRNASDVSLEAFVRDLSLQSMLLEQAENAGVRPAASEVAALDQAYRRALRETLALLGVSDSAPGIPAGQGPGRVSALVEGLSAERIRWRPLPSALGAMLREDRGYRLHRPGIARAAADAQQQLADTTR